MYEHLYFNHFSRWLGRYDSVVDTVVAAVAERLTALRNVLMVVELQRPVRWHVFLVLRGLIRQLSQLFITAIIPRRLRVYETLRLVLFGYISVDYSFYRSLALMTMFAPGESCFIVHDFLSDRPRVRPSSGSMYS